MYHWGYSIHSPFNDIPAPRQGSTVFSLQTASSRIANWFPQHGLQIAQGIVTNIISSYMSVIGVCVQRMNLEIMCILTSNTPGGITT
jgi:hypothetical protein